LLSSLAGEYLVPTTLVLTTIELKLWSWSIWMSYDTAPGTGFQSRATSVTVCRKLGLISSAAASPLIWYWPDVDHALWKPPGKLVRTLV